MNNTVKFSLLGVSTLLVELALVESLALAFSRTPLSPFDIDAGAFLRFATLLAPLLLAAATLLRLVLIALLRLRWLYLLTPPVAALGFIASATLPGAPLAIAAGAADILLMIALMLADVYAIFSTVSRENEQ